MGEEAKTVKGSVEESSFAEAVKALRRELGLTSQKALADHLGVSLRTVAGWEGGRIPGPSTLSRLIAFVTENNLLHLFDAFLEAHSKTLGLEADKALRQGFVSHKVASKGWNFQSNIYTDKEKGFRGSVSWSLDWDAEEIEQDFLQALVSVLTSLYGGDDQSKQGARERMKAFVNRNRTQEPSE